VTDDEERRVKAAPKPWLWALAVVLFTVAVYIPSLGAPFIWDDHYLIVNAPRVTKLEPLASYFDGSFWQREDLAPGERTYYRPLTILSFALDHVVHGNNPGGFHLSNVCLHAATALLLFALLGRRGLGPVASFVGALAWAWLPRLSEAAAWISGRTDVLATLFTLLGLLLYGQGRALARWLAAPCFVLGLLAKEVALAGVLAAGVQTWFESTNLPLQRRLARLLPAFGALALYVALRVAAVGLQLQSTGLAWGARIVHALEALGRYATMLLDPWQPRIQLGSLGDPAWGYVSVGVGALVALGYGLWRSWPKLDAFDRGALVLCGVSLGLVLHLVPIPVSVVAADRFLYLPTLGVVLLVAPRIARWLDGRAPLWSVALGAYIVSFAPITWLRTRAWADEVEFWSIAFYDQTKNNALSRLELGNVYSRAGLFSHASALFLDADEGDYAVFLLTRNNAGADLTFSGHAEQAVELLEDLVTRAPRVPKFRFTLAVAYGAAGRVDEAKKSVAAALRLFPTYAPALDYQRTLTEREEARAPEPSPETVAGQLAIAQRATTLDRNADAVRALLHASELGPLPAEEWTPALLFMFNYATFSQLETFFTRYRRAQAPNPVLLENFEARSARVQELRRLWPSLAPHLRQSRAGAAR
jgi:hypothetical protein